MQIGRRCLTIRKTAFNNWIIALFLVLMENCFYLIDTDRIPLGYSDLWLILFVCYYTFQYVKRNNRNFYIKKYNFRLVMYLLITIVVLSSIQAGFEYNQSILLGLRPQRRFLLLLICYYSLRLQFQRNKIEFDDIETIIINIGIFESILYCVQQAVFSSISFLHLSYNYRYGSVRLYIDSVVIVFMILFSFNKYIRNNKLYHLLPVALGLYYEITVSKGRLECIGIFAALIISFLLWKELSTRKFIGCIILIIAVVIFANTSIFNNFVMALEIKFGLVSQSSYLDTMAIRNDARTFYMNELFKSPIRVLFGCGYPNTDFQPAAIASGFNQGFIFADNGIFSFIYAYGLLGILFLLCLYFGCMRSAIEIYKCKNDVRYLTFFIFIVAISYNIIFWWWKPEWTYMLAILLASMEYEMICIKYNKN